MGRIRDFFGWVARGFKPVPSVVFPNIRCFAEHLDHWPDDDDVKRGEKILSHRVYKDTSCGAWLTFVYSPEPEQEKPSQEILAYGVFGIMIGSIVEGSDAEVEPVHLYFQFTEQDY